MHFQTQLQNLRDKDRYRVLNLPRGIDLSSNDYLGFRDHPFLKNAAIEAIENGVSLGAGASRLLRGHCMEHESLEHMAAAFFGSEKSLFFANGFQANVALFQTLPTRHDVIVFDSLIHASARDGIQASHARHVRVHHNDVQAYSNAIIKARKSGAKNIWIAVESLYSMDGDFAPLKALYELAQKYDAYLVVDEAHSTGVFGGRGEGLCRKMLYDTYDKHLPLAATENLTLGPPTLEPPTKKTIPTPDFNYIKLNKGGNGQNMGSLTTHPYPPNLITLHTCGKALGVAGGLVCASADIIDYMINKARPFIYSTAPPPLQAHLVEKSLQLCEREEGHRARIALYKLIEYARLKCENDALVHLNITAQSQIIPIILGDNKTAMDVAAALQNAGYDIRAIRPPTVPEGQARLRISLNANLSTKILDEIFSIL